jgi:hypothetical protein
MKMRRIPETDLASTATLPREKKVSALERLKSGFPNHTYNPTRSVVPEVLNLQTPFFDGAYSDWSVIDGLLKNKSRTPEEYKFNFNVAKLLYDFGVQKEIRSFTRLNAPWSVGGGQYAKYWWDVYSLYQDRPSYFFVDPRLSAPLTRGGIRFALSVMHERLRVLDPDFGDARLIVCQFPKGNDGGRTLKLFEHSDFELFSIDELDAMVIETYSIWAEVLQGREERARRTGTNPMGF